MSVGIDGNGTITGLSVGGLPDATIVDADIATLSSSKLTGALPAVDGSAVTGLTSANLTGALPAVDGSALTGVAPTKATIDALGIAASSITGALPAISGASLTNLPAGGKVLQVVGTSTTSLNSFTNTDCDAYADIGLSVNITPISSTSRFLITCSIGVGTVIGSNSWGGILFKNGTKIGNGTTTSNRKGVFFRGVDHAGGNGTDANHGVGGVRSYWYTTSQTASTQITFKVGGVVEGGTGYINRNENYVDTSLIYGAQTGSTITVMEVES
jgi:hypothetical protein